MRWIFGPRGVIWVGGFLGIASGYYIFDGVAQEAAARAREMHAERTRGVASAAEGTKAVPPQSKGQG